MILHDDVMIQKGMLPRRRRAAAMDALLLWAYGGTAAMDTLLQRIRCYNGRIGIDSVTVTLLQRRPARRDPASLNPPCLTSGPGGYVRVTAGSPIPPVVFVWAGFFGAVPLSSSAARRPRCGLSRRRAGRFVQHQKSGDQTCGRIAAMDALLQWMCVTRLGGDGGRASASMHPLS
jgi:hypothetical protein